MLGRERIVQILSHFPGLRGQTFWRRLIGAFCLPGLLLNVSGRAEAADFSRFLSPSNLPKRAKWHHSYKKALAESKKTQRPIMLVFTGEEWCRPCKYLQRKVFMKNEFHDWARKNVILAKIDLSREFKPTVFNIFERKKHEELLGKFRMRTIPTAIILSPGEQPMGILRFSGQTAGEYVSAAQRIIQRRKPGAGKLTL